MSALYGYYTIIYYIIHLYNVTVFLHCAQNASTAHVRSDQLGMVEEMHAYRFSSLVGNFSHEDVVKLYYRRFQGNVKLYYNRKFALYTLKLNQLKYKDILIFLVLFATHVLKRTAYAGISHGRGAVLLRI